MASVEYRTMVKCTSILTTAFESDPISIANDLLVDGFISSSVQNEVVNTAQANSYKASKLVQCVSSQISISNPKRVKEKFRKFIEVLERHTWLADTVDDVIQQYREFGGHFERSVQEDSSVVKKRPSNPQVPHKSADETKPWKGLTSPVNEQNLTEVLRDVAGSKVHRFGIALGVPNRIIKEFETNFPRDSARVKSEILRYWLDNAEDQSWKVIADAVRKVELSNLARYITGERGSSFSKGCTLVPQSASVSYQYPLRHRSAAPHQNNEQVNEQQMSPESSDSNSESTTSSPGSEDPIAEDSKKQSSGGPGTGLISKTLILLLFIVFVALISAIFMN